MLLCSCIYVGSNPLCPLAFIPFACLSFAAIGILLDIKPGRRTAPKAPDVGVEAARRSIPRVSPGRPRERDMVQREINAARMAGLTLMSDSTFSFCSIACKREGPVNLNVEKK